MKKILAALDLEQGTENILDKASVLAKALDAELVLVTVEPNLPGSVGASPEESVEEISQEFSGDVHKLHDYAEEFKSAGLDCRALILEGTAADQILHAVETVNPDMIIIGSHGHSAIFDTLSGSASQEIIQNAKRPVLLVPTS